MDPAFIIWSILAAALLVSVLRHPASACVVRNLVTFIDDCLQNLTFVLLFRTLDKILSQWNGTRPALTGEEIFKCIEDLNWKLHFDRNGQSYVFKHDKVQLGYLHTWLAELYADTARF